MKIEVINRSSQKVHQEFLETWCGMLTKELKNEGVEVNSSNNRLLIVFVDENEMQDLNKRFRNKDYPTDVLSFEPLEQGDMGELVLCSDVLRRQAKQHQLSYQHETGYMILHGILHLLGYNHETSKKDADLMFDLQDRVFERLTKRSASS